MPARPSLLLTARLSGLTARLSGAGLAFIASLFAAAASAAEPPASAKPAEAPPPAEPVTARIALELGPSVRLSDAPAFAITERAGLALAVSAAIAPSRLFDVVLTYERVGLGREHGGAIAPAEATSPDWVDVTRTLDAVWASVALRLVSAPAAKLSLVAGASLLWQHADASGALSQGEGAALRTFQCSASDSVNLGFRAGLGGEITLGSGFALLADASLDNLRLSSAALGSSSGSSSSSLGGCVPGAGTTALFSGRVGFAYRFDVSRLVR